MTGIDWKEYSLNEVCLEITDGSHFSPKEVPKGDRVIASVKDMNEYGFELTSCKRISEEDYQELVKNGCKPNSGDVLFSKDGTMGMVQYFDGGLDIVLLSSIAILRPNPELIHSKYLTYLLKNPETNKFIIENFKSGSALPRIVLKDLKKFKASVPMDLTEQSRIATILSSLDNKIELNLQMNKTLEAIAQAIFKEWFIDFRFPGFDGELVDGLPKGWKIGTILEKANLLSGGTPKTENKQFWNGDIKWISAKDITSNNGGFILSTEKQISGEGLERSAAKLLPRYTTIVSARGTVGNYCIISEEMAISQSNYGLKAKAVNSDFYLFLVVKNMIEKMKAYSYGTVFDTITTKTFKEIEVIVPTLDKIVLFNNHLTPLFMRILFNSQQNQILTRLRDALLPKLMTGKIRVS